MKNQFKLLLPLFALLIIFGCGEDPKPPVAEFTFKAAENDPYEIHFSVDAQNVTSYTWEFGDGTKSTEANPVHTYSTYGDFVIILTAKGDEGQVITRHTVTIVGSTIDMLTGKGSANGKKWVLSRTITAGLDGVGDVRADFSNNITNLPHNPLEVLGLTEEYDNIYTFSNDGTIDIDMVNGKGLVSFLYSYINQLKVSHDSGQGFAQSEIANIEDGTWKLIENTDLVVDAIRFEGKGDNAKEIEETITFKKANYLEFGKGGYIGMLDFTTKAIVRQISDKRLVVTFFMHGAPSNPAKPTNIVTISFDAVAK